MANEVGERLRQARERAGYATVDAVVAAFGWPTYADHEEGRTPVNPHQATVYARAFGANAVWLLSGEGTVRTEETRADQSAPRDERAQEAPVWDEPELGERIQRLNSEQRTALLAFLRAMQGG